MAHQRKECLNAAFSFDDELDAALKKKQEENDLTSDSPSNDYEESLKAEVKDEAEGASKVDESVD